MSSADIRGMFAGLPGAHGIIEAALNGQGRVMTDDSARPSSAAVLAGDFLYVSGQIPLDPATGEIVGGTAAEQAAQRVTVLALPPLGVRSLV